MRILICALFALVALSCAEDDTTEQCEQYIVAAVQDPGEFDTFSVIFERINCDENCETEVTFLAQQYENYLNKLGDTGCLRDLVQI